MKQLQQFMYGPQEVRTVTVNGELWFVAKDVCEVLELGNVGQALTRLDPEERTDIILNDGRQDRLQTAINETGLYSLILGSRKPEAKQFKRWITHEVIPSIRKTGSYSVEQFKIPQNMSEALRLAADLSEKNEQISADNERLSLQTTEQQQKLKEQETPVAIYQLAISAHNTMSMQEVAKSLNTGRTRLYQVLRLEGVILKDSTMPYQRYLDAGYFKVIERPRASGDTIVNDPATRVTAKGFDFIARLMKKRTDREAGRLEREA